MPRCVSAGTELVDGRLIAQPLLHLFSRKTRSRIVDRRLYTAPQQLVAQIDVRFKLMGFAQEDERRFGR